jgi:hypothetical protein
MDPALSEKNAFSRFQATIPVAAERKKKPTCAASQGNSHTSVYWSTGHAAEPGCLSASLPTTKVFSYTVILRIGTGETTLRFALSCCQATQRGITITAHLLFSACHPIIPCRSSSGNLNAAPPKSSSEVVGRLNKRQPGHAGGLVDE